MIYRTDYHTHTTFSDGKADPEEYISQAISAGIKEIGFSEHLNLFVADQQWCMDPKRVPEYISHIARLKKKFSGIKIKTGLEVDYFPGKEEEIYEFINGLELDYVIGSVHYLGEKTVDSGPDFYENRNIDELYELYFGYVDEAVASGLFDIIAHCDLIRIYNFRPAASPEHFYRRLAGNMKIHDVAFEVNTNGRNRPLGDFYPDRRFLKIFSEENVPVCVNSDAHLPIRVGQYFDEAYMLLKEAGFKEMAVFNKRERFLVPADF
ncbi:MAG TPA: histidinol-phosphatase [Ignavibacteria bacterium]